jgi:hypothetical protein
MASTNLIPVYGSDNPLLYNVPPWNIMGFAVPNWGPNVGTKNIEIHGLVDEMGRHQLNVMTHEDAMRAAYPSINTVQRLAKIVNRVKTVLQGRKKASTETRIEQTHFNSSVLPWVLHPVPFHRSGFVINPWLKTYNMFAMMAITNCIQYSDNNLTATLTEELAACIWQFFREIGRLVASELLGMDPKLVDDPAFTFTEDMVKSGYATIAQRTLSVERLCTPGPIQSTPTEVDLTPLFLGFPTTVLISVVAQYPVDIGTGAGFSGAGLPGTSQTPGVAGGTQIGPAGSGIGEPQV